jgi:iron complex outermembrane recepter protein
MGRTTNTRRVALTAALLASTALCSSAVFGPALAQETKPADKPVAAKGPIERVTVTAQKRSQALQDVPASVAVISTKKIEELQINDINDYSKFLPAVTIQPTSPGFVGVYMRGVASGENRNHSGPMPSVGTYLDEIPITTISGALDLHAYDIERIEALAGPQGTLYGANSQSGTLRIITNKPDPGEFSASYSVELNSVENGGIGGGVEGHVNAPLSDSAAIRIVGWSQHDAGYIDNVAGARFYPTSGVLHDNFDVAKDDYNEVDTYGARIALGIELDDNWTVTPMVMAQDEKTEGVFFYDPSVGDLAVTHWFPENSHDKWVLAALTIQGKVANLDVTYAGGYLDRTIDSNLDYADYGFFYDTVLGYGSYFTSDGVTPILPAQYINARDGFTKESHEFRVASPAEDRLRFIAGLFYQRQEHEIYQRYLMDGFFDDHEVTTLDDTIWLTSQKRIDVDKAIFGEVSFDLTDSLTATGGLRLFRSENSLEGFFGFSGNFATFYGYDVSTPAARAETPSELACGEPGSVRPPTTRDAPCTNLNKLIEEDGSTYRLNLAYSIDDDRMIYATWSTGYRPGGVNRRGTLAPYSSDFLTNYEIGWKTMLADGRLRFNGAVFYEEWEDFQFSFLGQNGLTQIQNAGAATIKGIESDILWAPSDNFTLTAAVSWTEAEFEGDAFPPATPGDPPTLATPGLPVTPDLKVNLIGRYTFEFMGLPAYAQGALVHVSEATVDLRAVEAAIIGDLPAYTLVDLSTGFDAATFSLDFFIHNVTDERAVFARTSECAITTCGTQPYDAVAQPRTYGVRFGQRF